MGQKGNTYMEPSFEKMCLWAFGLADLSQDLLDAQLVDIHKKFAKARHTGKSKFTCTFIATE